MKHFFLMKLIFYLFISSFFYGCETIGVGIFGVAKCGNGNWVNLRNFKRKLPALSDSTSWDFFIKGDFSNRIRFSDSSKYSPESISGLKGELANNLVQIRRNITAENQKIKLDNDLKLSLIRTNPCQITNELIESILLSERNVKTFDTLMQLATNPNLTLKDKTQKFNSLTDSEKSASDKIFNDIENLIEIKPKPEKSKNIPISGFPDLSLFDSLSIVNEFYSILKYEPRSIALQFYVNFSPKELAKPSVKDNLNLQKLRISKLVSNIASYHNVKVFLNNTDIWAQNEYGFFLNLTY